MFRFWWYNDNIPKWEESVLGKKNYVQSNISAPKTEILGIDELLVLGTEGDEENFYAVHRRYFTDEKSYCPACGSTRTRCSKVVHRSFKDIIGSEPNFRIINLHFYQRYLRCDSCGESVFPEPIGFGEKSFRYTHRLADALADGTFSYSYKKVCEKYGVPASTASVGAIMRRQIAFRESQLRQLKTPGTVCVVEVPFYGELYPVILAVWNGRTYCLDILQDTSESTYVQALNPLNSANVRSVFIDPSDSLSTAVAHIFPSATPMVTDECIRRYARASMEKAIDAKGKRLALREKKDHLLLHGKHLSGTDLAKQIKNALSTRPKLKAVYDCYQSLLDLLEVDWTYEDLAEWSANLPSEITEFADLQDAIEIYEAEICSFITNVRHTPEEYSSSAKAVCDAIAAMPHCIFEVFRARCLLTSEHDNVADHDKIFRLGIPVDRMKNKMNEISSNIKERRDYGL